jgi:translation initiation factor 5
MPKLQTKVQGRGNGIHTALPNLVEIGKALKRPPGYICKFFATSLGSQSRLDDMGVHIVNGSFSYDVLFEQLEKFISIFVLCGKCRLPETDLEVKPKSEKITMRCHACGAKTPVDTRHVLCSYIFKNPPDDSCKQKAGSGVNDGADDEKKDKKDKKDKKEKKEGKEAKSSKKSKKTEDADAEVDEEMFKATLELGKGAEEEVQWATDTTPEATEQRRLELIGSLSAKATAELLVAEGAGGGSGSPAKAASTPKGKEAAAAAAAAESSSSEYEYESESEDDGDTSSEAFIAYAKSHLADPAKVKVKFDAFCAANGLDKRSKRERMLMGALVDGEFAKRAKQICVVAKRVLGKSEDPAASQRNIMNTIELIIANAHPEAVPTMPKILEALYDNDLVEEEVLVQWWKEPKAKDVSKEDQAKIREVCKAYITWLQEAETESD